ncbi:MAG: phasin family protein [Gammaproteobacteria bacterium]|nr:phasin family protein [Gammaproteobacteria bacterium]
MATKKAKPASAAVEPSASSVETGATGLLGAGLQTLKDVRDDVRARRSRVFGALLGLNSRGAEGEPASVPTGPSVGGAGAADAQQGFEDVFDQRVAQSLQRLGYPSADDMVALIRLLQEQVEPMPRARSAGRKRAGARKAQP